MNTNFERMEIAIQVIAEMSEEQRQAFFKINFKELKGLEGEELRQRLSKSGFIGDPCT